MVLQDLADNIGKAFKNLTKNLTIDDEAIKETLKGIVEALKEADVHVDLVKKVEKNLKKQLLSDNFKKYANKQTACKHMVWKEIYNLLNPGTQPFNPQKGKKNVLMFVGLQGSGKTTTIAKVALYYKRRKWKCALVCADTFRAGAFDQLKQNATKIGVPFYGSHTETDPVKLASDGVKQFKEEDYDLIMVDTSGRHRQEKSLFREMKQIEKAIEPNDIVFIMDGTIGQAAMEQAKAFKETVNIGTCIMTKMDGNTKGGGALAAVAATKSPITFLGSGEHFQDIETFNPQGYSSRLLGYGDPQALIDKMKGEDFDEKKQKEMLKKLVEGTFTMRDLHEQLSMIMKMGPISDVVNLISPQLNKMINKSGKSIDVVFKKYLTVMDSMTNYELDHPNFANLKKQQSRIERLALGSGCSVEEVSELFGQYKEFKKMFGKLSKKVNLKEMMKNQNDPQAAMRMFQNMIPGGARNAARMQKMYQQFSRMGGAPKGMRMKFK